MSVGGFHGLSLGSTLRWYSDHACTATRMTADTIAFRSWSCFAASMPMYPKPIVSSRRRSDWRSGVGMVFQLFPTVQPRETSVCTAADPAAFVVAEVPPDKLTTPFDNPK